MLHTKEFYEIMSQFEKDAKNFYIRVGSQGLKREDKNNWERKKYYCDGEANKAFILYLLGVSLGKTL
jgi:hypothetical protein